MGSKRKDNVRHDAQQQTSTEKDGDGHHGIINGEQRVSSIGKAISSRDSHIDDGRKDQPLDGELAQSLGTSEHDNEGDSDNVNGVDSGQQSADHEEPGIKYNILHVTNASDLSPRHTSSSKSKKKGKPKIPL